MRTLPALAALLFLAVLATAADKTAPAGGRSLLPDTWSDGAKLGGEKQYGTQRRIVVTGQPFDSAIEITTDSPPPNPYALQLIINTTGPVTQGDTLYATFWARSERGMAGAAFVDFAFEKASEDWKKSIIFPTSVRGEWTQIQVPFTAADSYAAGAAHAIFRVGYAAQTVQIAGATLVDYGPSVAVNSLPQTQVTYDGRAADAPWRAAAAQRIDQFRKADIHVHVTGADGKPLANTSVTIAMQRQAFGFGTCVNAEALANNNPADEPYRTAVASLFNEVVFENDLKWDAVEHGSDQQVKPALDWLDAHHIRTRGHNLVWPSWQYSPASVTALQNDPSKLKTTIEQHITKTVDIYKGRLIDWDVVNEPFNNHDVMDLLGNGVMGDWFKLARAADPGAKLYLNDWGITEGGGNAKVHQDSDFETLKSLKNSGAPLDGFGLQSHFDNALTGPARVYEILERYASLGLRLKVTELDVSVTDPQTQGDYLRDYMTICYSHPNIDAILLWGFWEKRHWLPKAALYNADWSPRPVAKAFTDLVFHEWWTDEKVMTDANGDARARGFLGDYAVSADGVSKTITLDHGGVKVDLTLAK